jgi:hypothetical protein
MTNTLTSMTKNDDGVAVARALPAPAAAGGQTGWPAAESRPPAGLGEQR